MDALTLFGLVAVTSMLLFCAFEQRSPWCIVGFAIACAMGSTYGFLQGAWPFGLVEGVWTLVALFRWRRVARNDVASAKIAKCGQHEHAQVVDEQLAGDRNRELGGAREIGLRCFAGTIAARRRNDRILILQQLEQRLGLELGRLPQSLLDLRPVLLEWI